MSELQIQIPRIIEALDIGIEFGMEVIADYDSKYGRSYPSNKRAAELMDADLLRMREMRKFLEDFASNPQKTE